MSQNKSEQILKCLKSQLLWQFVPHLNTILKSSLWESGSQCSGMSVDILSTYIYHLVFKQDTKNLRLISRLQASLVSSDAFINGQKKVKQRMSVNLIHFDLNHRYGQMRSLRGTRQFIHLRKWSCRYLKSGPQNFMWRTGQSVYTKRASNCYELPTSLNSRHSCDTPVASLSAVG